MSFSFNDDNLMKNNLDDSDYLLSKRDLLLFKNIEHDYKFVLDTLIEVCNYEPVRAEQCAFLVDYKGFCQIKSGLVYNLNRIKKEFERKGLWAEII